MVLVFVEHTHRVLITGDCIGCGDIRHFTDENKSNVDNKSVRKSQRACYQHPILDSYERMLSLSHSRRSMPTVTVCVRKFSTKYTFCASTIQPEWQHSHPANHPSIQPNQFSHISCRVCDYGFVFSASVAKISWFWNIERIARVCWPVSCVYWFRNQNLKQLPFSFFTWVHL